MKVIALLGCTVPRADVFSWEVNNMSSEISSETAERMDKINGADELDEEGDSQNEEEV